MTRSAERVGLSQPAMSHALTRMRRLLGDELVVRQGSGVTLTPATVRAPRLRGWTGWPRSTSFPPAGHGTTQLLPG